MANYGANLYLVPKILKVKTSEEVSLMCLVNNTINNQKYNYALPAPFVNGFYEIQFYADMKDWKNPQKLSKKELLSMGVFE